MTVHTPATHVMVAGQVAPGAAHPAPESTAASRLATPVSFPPSRFATSADPASGV